MMRLAVAIPDSTVNDSEHLRDKTVKLGYIARALTIFRVSDIYIYTDPTELERSDGPIIKDILGYAECPQYLRRHLYPKNANLRYAGLLPPLRAPHHKLRPKNVMQLLGDVREGVITASRSDLTLVDIGLDRDAILQGHGAIGARITCVVEQVEPHVTVRRVAATRTPGYWGYKVHGPLSLESIHYDMFDLVVLTSRLGRSISEIWDEFSSRVRRASRMLILFGSPRRGLKEIYSKTGLTLEKIGSYTVNMVPEQGTATIRVEEALMATLSIVNLAGHDLGRH